MSQSWNQIEVLACILPNDPAHTLHVNEPIMESNRGSCLHLSQRSCSQPTCQRHNDLATRKTLAVFLRRKEGCEEICIAKTTYVPHKSLSSTVFSEEATSSDAVAHAVEIVKQITTNKKLAPTSKRTQKNLLTTKN